MWHAQRMIFVLTFLVPHGVITAQEPGDIRSSPSSREFFALRTTDGMSHEIEAVALRHSADADIVYAVERASIPRAFGVPKPPEGTYLLWELDAHGRVLHKTPIGKILSGGPARVTILPLPLPHDGVVLVGMFDDRFGWRLIRVDGSGKITKSVKLINEPGAFLGAALLPDAQGVLLAGQYGLLGSVWKVDLDGKVMWRKVYEDIPNAAKSDDAKEGSNDGGKASTRTNMQFNSIVSTEKGGFLVAGDFGEIDKAGGSDKTVWVIRCDPEGKVLNETHFSGRQPTLCDTGIRHVAVVYNAKSAPWGIAPHIQMLGWSLHPIWKRKIQMRAVWPDVPAMGAIPASGGLVVAGANITIDRERNRIVGWDCQVFTFNGSGDITSSVSIPVAKETFLFTRVACGADRAYVAINRAQGPGSGPQEAAIVVVPLHKPDK
jgi:hypothetical protein